MEKKIILVLVDGLGGVPHPELNGKTPLQYSNTPCMDELAGLGSIGLMDSVAPGMTCDSDVAHLGLLGYDPFVGRGRGSFETMGGGLDLEAGDIGFKCVFSWMNNVTGIVERRKSDSGFSEWGKELSNQLTGLFIYGIKVTVKYTREHRCVIRLRGPGLSDEITGTDPLKDGMVLLRCTPTESHIQDSKALFTCRVVEELSRRLRNTLCENIVLRERHLSGKPSCNVILFRGAAKRVEFEPFQKRYGLKPIMIAPTEVIRGLGIALGFSQVCPVAATGDYDSDLLCKADALFNVIEGFDFGFIHIKQVDKAGHDKDVWQQVEWLQRVDILIRHLVDLFSTSGSVLAVTGDHSTSCITGSHSHEPVPLLIYKFSTGITRTPTHRVLFDEVSCGDIGSLSILGSELIPLLQNTLSS